MTTATLSKGSLSRHKKTIQISSNIKFVSIEFHTKDIMEIFCLETPQVKIHNMQFLTDYKQLRQNKKPFINNSLLNVPAEAADELNFLKTMQKNEGPAHCFQKNYNSIKHFTGTQVYQVSKIYVNVVLSMSHVSSKDFQ